MSTFDLFIPLTLADSVPMKGWLYLFPSIEGGETDSWLRLFIAAKIEACKYYINIQSLKKVFSNQRQQLKKKKIKSSMTVSLQQLDLACW